MQNELKEKLENLSEKFNTDLDIISLKALCQVPENEQILFAITGTLQRLIDKYPDDEEILNLLPKISLEDLIKLLEEKYFNNVEVITIKALSALPEGEDKENAIKKCLERLLEKNSNDETILDYLKIEKTIVEDENPDMIFVKGGSYKPSFCSEDRIVFDLYVNKYDTTQDEWQKYMNSNPSTFKGERRPIENIEWIEALEFCNKMSEEYRLQPVYKIENKKLAKIIYKNGEEVYPDLADFEKTEGYRLPREIEWEWFAFGGQNAIQNETFDKTIDGTTGLTEKNKYSDLAWYGLSNSYSYTYGIGLKKPNELGLYDVIGNVYEMLYDTYTQGYIDKNRGYIFNDADSRKARGGCYSSNDQSCIYTSTMCSDKGKGSSIGFRIIRTVNPKK